MYASGSYVLTQSFITCLRRDKVIEREMKLMDKDSIKELGIVNLVYKLKVTDFED